MFNTPILDIIMGLVFIFLLYSLLATSVKEAIAAVLGLRARMLRRGIVEAMLSDTPNHPKWVSMLIGIWDYVVEFIMLFAGRRWEKKRLGYHFYKHPLMKNYGSNRIFSHPSYIPSQNFSLILIETLKWDFVRKLDDIVNVSFDPRSGLTADQYREQLLNSPDAMQVKVLLAFYLSYYKALKQRKEKTTTSKLDMVKYWFLGEQKLENQGETMKNMEKVRSPDRTLSLMKEPIIDQETLEILQLHLTKSIYNIEAFGGRIEQWFNDTMDRVSGWYKRQVQVILMIIGFVMAFMFNVDVIDITTKLSKDDKLRDKLVQSAVAYSKGHQDLPGDGQGSGGNRRNAAADSTDSAYRKDVKDRFRRVDSMVDHDIHDVNTLLALGYGDYGKSDAKFVERLKRKEWSFCWIPIHSAKNKYDTIRRDGIDLRAYLRDSFRCLADRDSSTRNALWKEWVRKKPRDLALLGAIRSRYVLKDDAGFAPVLDSIMDARFHDTQVNEHPFLAKTYYMRYTFSTSGRKWLGFLLLGLSVSLGAPFWFDLLNKIVNLRSAGKKEGETSGDSSKPAKDTVKTPDTPAVIVNVKNQPGEQEAVG